MNNNEQQYKAMYDDALRRNKGAVFAALTETGITSLTVEFDGYGDNGQIQTLTAYAGESTTDLPRRSVTIHSVERVFSANHFETIEKIGPQPLAEAIEALCYHHLDERHGGWEINDGSFGTFEFNAADRAISLDFNQRSTITDFEEF